jgi:hypothetical protein
MTSKQCCRTPDGKSYLVMKTGKAVYQFSFLIIFRSCFQSISIMWRRKRIEITSPFSSHMTDYVVQGICVLRKSAQKKKVPAVAFKNST